jgi:hypothetical protein
VKHCARILDQFGCTHFVFVVKQLRLWPKKLVFRSYRRTKHSDKGRIGSYTKLCDFTLLFMILQVELRLNKGSLVRPRLVDQVKACTSIMMICEHYRDLRVAQNGVRASVLNVRAVVTKS